MKTKKIQIPDSDTIFNIDLLDEGGFNPDRIRVMIYGESGIGKTRFASTWPKPFFLDIDDGMASVDIPVARRRILQWEDIADTYEWLATSDHEFQTIVIDSLNEAQALALRNTVIAFPKIRRSYESLPSQSDYGKMLSDFDNMLRHFKSLHCHLVLITQVSRKEHDTDIVQPQMIGKNTTPNVSRMMDLIGYLYREADSLAMAFESPEYIGKDRSGTLPPVVLKPTYQILVNYWAPK